MCHTLFLIFIVGTAISRKNVVGVSVLKDGEAVTDDIIKVNEETSHRALFEGDILLHVNEFEDQKSERYKRNAKRPREYLWKDKVIPYEISTELKHATDLIVIALREFEKVSCLRFKPRQAEANWIKFVRLDGCYSSVGKVYWRPGPQDISLGDGCLKKGTIIHEVMHSLGFWHEQSRPDRNKYVEIFWENVIEVEVNNFNKYSHQAIDTLGVEYDYGSIMHYGKRAFSKNGKRTIAVIGNTTFNLGQRSKLSTKDIIQLNALYDCKGAKQGAWSSWSDFGPCDDQCYKKRQRFCFDSSPQICPNSNAYGVQSDVVKCRPVECLAPIEGHWGRWSLWSSCSRKCGLGTRNRTRSCDDPEPKYGGKPCHGTMVQAQNCMLQRCGLGPDDCEFDGQGWCFWTNDVHNNKHYYWSRISGSTPSVGTGPPGDHSSGQGHYIYSEASAPAATGHKTRLISKEFNNSSPRCMSFWYYMFGTGIGSLRVFLKFANGNEQQLWEKSGSQGNRWLQCNVTIDTVKRHKVIFESERGSDFLSDIAIDDITFKEYSCFNGPRVIP